MKIVIVGGVAGGASAAARARRLSETAEIILLQSGPDVSFASCGMPYFIGGEITDRVGMSVQTPASLYNRLNITVRVLQRVTAIDTTQKQLTVTSESDNSSYVETYEELILAVGASPMKPPIPGIDRPGLFALRNLVDMDSIVSWIEKNDVQHAVVAGAGFVGLEMVEQLIHRNIQVSLVEMMPQILGPIDEEMAAYLHNDLNKRGVNVIVNNGIAEFQPDPSNPDVASILKLQSGLLLPSAQLTILGLGVRPDTLVAKEAGIATTPRGHIIVDEHLHTGTDSVWAVGDAVEVNNPILGGDNKWGVPLAGPANRQGRMVADNILSGKPLRKYKGTYAVSVVRSFDLYAACVGLNEKFLRSQKIPYQTVHIHPNSHAGYYPGAQQIHLKLLFNPTNGSVFGAQAVGQDGIEKRIDVIATAMQGGMTVRDLAELELCYAPPVGSAKDPVNYAGMAAENIMEGLVNQVKWHELDDLIKDQDNVVVLDVRNPGEITNTGKFVEHAINIPLDELRNRLTEVPRDKKIVVSCMSGQRAYYACRILMQNGFENVVNVGGAYKTFHEIHPNAIP